MPRPHPRLGVVTLLAAGLLSACSTEGAAVRGPIDLDTGPYLTRQSAALTAAATDVDWARLRGVRLADHIAFTGDIDPSLIELKLPTQPLARPENLAVVARGAADAPVSRSFEYGFTVIAGTASGDDAVSQTLVKFVDAAAARAAVVQYSALDLRRDEYDRVVERTRVAGMPAASRIVRRTGVHGWETTAAFTAHGPYLIHTWAQSQTRKDRAWTAGAVLTAYRKQRPLLDAMPTESTDRQPDPTGLLRGNVAPEHPGDPGKRIVLGTRGAAVLFADGAAAYTALQKFGVTALARDDTEAYRAGSGAQARGLRDHLLDLYLADSGRAAPSPRDLPAARCARSDAGHTCFVAVGRLVGVADGDTLTEAQQMVSAQSVFLAAM